MVDYDTAVASVQDPNADPAFLAKIAYENPEFGANVAAHQRAYPGLIRWLAQFGDDRARQIVIQRGYAVPETAVAPHEQPAQDSPVQERQFAQERQPIQEQRKSNLQCRTIRLSRSIKTSRSPTLRPNILTPTPILPICPRWRIMPNLCRSSRNHSRSSRLHGIRMASPRKWH